MIQNAKTGILLINLGTPDAPDTSSCRRYLKEFLMDPFVIDLPWVLRAMLVYGIIAPFRSSKSAHAYRNIWLAEGSPLRVEGAKLEKALQKEMGDSFLVRLGMRYGNPSVASILEEWRALGIQKLKIVPLYPQYADATTRSSVERVYSLISRWDPLPEIEVVPPFYNHPSYIEAAIAAWDPTALKSFDHILFSFHGLPVRQIKKADSSKSHCIVKDRCCDQPTAASAFCYRHHCFETARKMAEKLDLKTGSWSVSFQSRLGRAEWISPFTEEEMARLASSGVKRLAVACPSFVADCLETLEEIGLRGTEVFKNAGGEVLTLLPCLNHHSQWVKALKQLCN